jgi:hypothetical protein
LRWGNRAGRSQLSETPVDSAREMFLSHLQEVAQLVSGDQRCVQLAHLGDMRKQLAHRSDAIRSLSVK